MPGYGARYWAERTKTARRPRYPSLKGAQTADVVVIGGGFTGVVAAYVFAKGGLDVVLVEQDRLASAGTSSGLGVLSASPHVSYRTIESAVGRKGARAAWSLNRASALETAALLRRLKVKCDLVEAGFATAAATPELAATLAKERTARLGAGLDVAWMRSSAIAGALGATPIAAMVDRVGFTFDPVQATLGLAKAAERAGARLHENTEVRRTTFTRKSATVVCDRGTIATPFIYVATGAPGRLFGSLRRHVDEAEGYAVVTEPLSSTMKREVGRRHSVMTDGVDSPRFLRWLDDGRAMFAGAASRPAGSRGATKVLVQRTGQLMYELSLRHPSISGLPARWSWPVPVISTADGLPWIGSHRNFPFHFFAMAFGWHGDGLALFAARTALKQFKGERNPEGDTFGFGR